MSHPKNIDFAKKQFYETLDISVYSKLLKCSPRLAKKHIT